LLQLFKVIFRFEVKDKKKIMDDLFLQRVAEDEHRRKRRMMMRDKGLQLAQSLNMFEVDSFSGKASSLCVINKIEGGTLSCVARVASILRGLTFETFNIISQSEFASRLENKTVELLLPSTSFPSVRAAINYKPFDSVQVASHNGTLWLNGVVITPVCERQELFVQLDSYSATFRPVCVKLSSIRLKDWFMLHENCRSTIYCSFLFLRRVLGHDMAKTISKIIWETRDDREWDY
jgi:hypothetical protein